MSHKQRFSDIFNKKLDCLIKKQQKNYGKNHNDQFSQDNVFISLIGIDLA